MVVIRVQQGCDPESAQIHLILLMTEFIRSLIPTLHIIAHIASGFAMPKWEAPNSSAVRSANGVTPNSKELPLMFIE